MRDDAARLDRHAGHAREVEGRLHHDVGLGEPARDVADGAPRDARHVVGPVIEDPRRSGRERALDAGCDDYDTKPIELPRLLEKIEALLPRPTSA